MDVVVIARMAGEPPAASTKEGAANQDPALYASTATFRVEQVLKSMPQFDAKSPISLVFFGDSQPSDRFLLMGSDPQELAWSPPMKLNERQYRYVQALTKLPPEGADRLAFFQQYLQDPDPELAGDAYTEFARAPYSAVKQLKPRMNRDQLIAWIKDPGDYTTHRSLYLTMLGVCGSQDDIPMLEAWLHSDDPQSKVGLDALIACYLTLRGPAGMELIEQLYLRKGDDNFSSNYADVYAAIVALRFHGTEQDVVPRARVLRAFSLLLDSPQMADLVIPDLARWEDWSHLKRMVALFKGSDEKSSWVRTPIVNYVRACPLPEAKEALELFEQIDPETVKRAMIFFPARTE